MGEKFIVTGYSASVFRGSWRMKTWIVPGAPKIDHVPKPKSDDLSKFKKIIDQREKEAKVK